jgi:lipopolysaccharide/colanic/teichoic acid biosynthesis glycosyltransferase
MEVTSATETKQTPKKNFLSRRHVLKAIHPKDQFDVVYQFEKERCHRTGNIFSLVAFTFHQNPRLSLAIRRFITKIKNRVRTCDIMGWLDERNLGILLPDTERKGAEELAESIRAAMPPKKFRYDIKVYCYPEDSIPCKVRAVNGDGEAAAEGTRSQDDEEPFLHYLVQPIPWWKRTLDIIGASAALILFSPLMLLIAAYIKAVSPGPIIFRQERLGFLGRPFTCYKFRTMHTDHNPDKHKQHLSDLIHGDKKLEKIDDDPNSGIIPFGNVIRKAGLDELPQLFNTLKGDMSLIGPRPCMVYEAAEFESWHHRRFDTKPGLTGLWQVSGKNQTTFNEMMRLDINYSRQKSLTRDISIVVKTLPAVYRQFMEKKTTNKLEGE